MVIRSGNRIIICCVELQKTCGKLINEKLRIGNRRIDPICFHVGQNFEERHGHELNPLYHGLEIYYPALLCVLPHDPFETYMRIELQWAECPNFFVLTYQAIIYRFITFFLLVS